MQSPYHNPDSSASHRDAEEHQDAGGGEGQAMDEEVLLQAEIAELMRDAGSPRCAHYQFVHVALRDLAFSHRFQGMALLASREGPAFIADLLAMVSSRCRGWGEPEPDFSASDIRVQTAEVDEFPCVVVEMPRPRAGTEAYFAAILLHFELASLPRDAPWVPIRYFTLEEMRTPVAPPRTILCEWTEEGEHRWYEDSPAPNLDSFLHAVTRLLTT